MGHGGVCGEEQQYSPPCASGSQDIPDRQKNTATQIVIAIRIRVLGIPNIFWSPLYKYIQPLLEADSAYYLMAYRICEVLR